MSMIIRELNDSIESMFLPIDDIDRREDQIFLLEILNILFPQRTRIFIIGFCENDFIVSAKERNALKEKIDCFFKVNGEYRMIDQVSTRKFKFCGMFDSNPESMLSMIYFWKYYRGFNFFMPHSETTFNYLISMSNDYFENDPDGLKLFQKKIFNFYCIKDYDDQGLTINYLKEWNFPKKEITKLISPASS